MKLPPKVLHGLAVAIAGLGLAGCDLRQAPPNSSNQNSTDPSANPNNGNGQEPGERCEPTGACPACGRG
jgi:hypothetical protein